MHGAFRQGPRTIEKEIYGGQAMTLASSSPSLEGDNTNPSRSPPPLTPSLSLVSLLTAGPLTPGRSSRRTHQDIFKQPRDNHTEGGDFSRMGVRISQSLPLPRSYLSWGRAALVSPLSVSQSVASSPLTLHIIVLHKTTTEGRAVFLRDSSHLCPPCPSPQTLGVCS